MTLDERSKVFAELFSEMQGMATTKGKAYSGTEDSLANFKRNAANLGLSAFQVWAVYAGKHIDSIMNAVKYTPEYPIDKTEGMHGRIVDAMVYLGILECLLKDEEILAKNNIITKEPIKDEKNDKGKGTPSTGAG